MEPIEPGRVGQHCERLLFQWLAPKIFVPKHNRTLSVRIWERWIPKQKLDANVGYLWLQNVFITISESCWFLHVFFFLLFFCVQSVAGLEPITWNHPRMHNVDLSSIVAGHRDYATKIDEILEFLGYGMEELDGPTQLRRTHSSNNIREKEVTLHRCTSEESFFLVTSTKTHLVSESDFIQKKNIGNLRTWEVATRRTYKYKFLEESFILSIFTALGE